MNRGSLGVVLGVLLTATGCAKQDQVAALEGKVNGLETKIESLQSSLADLQVQEFLQEMESTAYLTPGADGYSVVKSDLGLMTVSLEDVRPYANGCRISLKVGNLTSATVNGAKAKVEWGSVDEKGVPKPDSNRSRDLTFIQSLRPGAWTSVQLVLEGVPPTDLGFVRIKQFTHTGIGLIR